MQLWIITLGFVCVLGAIAIFLVYFISTALDFDDAHRIDKVPQNDFDKNEQP